MNQQRRRPNPESTKLEPGPQGSSQSPTRPSKPPYDKLAWLKKDTAAQLISIIKDELTPDPNQVDSKSGFEVLCSYNWYTAETASIYVPGAPPRWTPRELPMTLEPDKGQHFIDQNAHLVPSYPFEPIFRALPVMSPDFKFNKIDFVSNRNSMRKLLNFVAGTVDDPFRIDLNVIQNTLFFTRRERRTVEIIRGPQKFPGFGHNFEKRFTVPQQGLEESTSHHRVIRYKLGDLDCVMRYEVDAWLAPEDDNEEACGRSAPVTEGKNDEDELLASLKGLSINISEPVSNKALPNSKTKSISNKTHDKATKVTAEGTLVDANRLAELKSRSRSAKKRDMVPQLWFGRIPFLAIGTHDKGTVTDVAVKSTAEDFENFETQGQENLRRLVFLIKSLKNLARSRLDKACIVVCEPKVKPLQLKVYASNNRKLVLPPEVTKSYWTSGGKRKT